MFRPLLFTFLHFFPIFSQMNLYEIVCTYGDVSMVIGQPIGPTTHWSEDPLVRRRMVLKSVIGPKTIGPKKCVIGPKIAGPKGRFF